MSLKLIQIANNAQRSQLSEGDTVHHYAAGTGRPPWEGPLGICCWGDAAVRAWLPTSVTGGGSLVLAALRRMLLSRDRLSPLVQSLLCDTMCDRRWQWRGEFSLICPAQRQAGVPSPYKRTKLFDSPRRAGWIFGRRMHRVLDGQWQCKWRKESVWMLKYNKKFILILF